MQNLVVDVENPSQHKIMNNKIEKLPNGDFKVVSEMEECIICGVDTNEPKDKHIDYRYNYVEGAGQLCSKCAEKYE
jgi:hypothetical protein